MRISIHGIQFFPSADNSNFWVHDLPSADSVESARVWYLVPFTVCVPVVFQVLPTIVLEPDQSVPSFWTPKYRYVFVTGSNTSVSLHCTAPNAPFSSAFHSRPNPPAIVRTVSVPAILAAAPSGVALASPS